MRLVYLVLLAPAVAAAQPAFDELPKGSWPGVSLEDTRGLPECTLDDPAPRVGAPITCRPPVLPAAAHLGFDLSWITGLAVVDGEARGIHGLAADAEWFVSRGVALGARYELSGIGDGGIGSTGIAQLRYRAFTDEVDRDAFTIAVGGGFAGRGDLGSEPVARVAVGRDIGYVVGEQNGVTWAWELAGEQGLGAMKIATITAGVRAGFELGIREPRNLRTRDQDPPVRYAVEGEFRASPEIGMGASLDFAFPGIATDRALLRTTAMWTTDHDGAGEHGLRGTWGAVIGPRVFLVRGELAPYVDLQAGPAAVFRPMETGAALGVLAEGELGLDFHLGCQTTLDLAGRIQTEIDGSGVDVRTGFFILRVAHGTALRRGSCEADEAPIAR